ncbi:MAG: xylose isomerase [Chloroflexi bacterium RBG_16_68_14]|nr:MAG: xylose isomerase [Chloroflexi bacterium RBG_16_68_14]
MRREALVRISVANAPCSWGVVEGFASGQPGPGYAQVLDEMAAAGYAGTELGDWGFMPTDAETLRAELAGRRLALVGAFVPVALADAASHAPGEADAARVARLLAQVAPPESLDGAPFLVLADDSGTDPTRTRMAGRLGPSQGLSEGQWRTFVEGAQRIADAVRRQTGLHTVFHHHCGSYVETPAEIETFLGLTDPDLIGLCFDTGHYTYGGGDALDGLRRFGERVWHVHLKDCDGAVAERARGEGWDYFEAVRNGIFCELGKGQVDFPALLEELANRRYQGWIVVEQDIAPGTGTPFESAQRGRTYLRGLGL